MCLMKQLRMFRPKITKMRAIKEAMTAHPQQPVWCRRCIGANALAQLACQACPAQLAEHVSPILKWRLDLSFLMENGR